MNIREAYEELKRLYPHESVEVSYNINNFPNGEDEITCIVYRSGAGEHFGKGPTWRTALDNLTFPKTIQVQYESCEDGESLLDHERLEDARLTAAEVRRERREAKG